MPGTKLTEDGLSSDIDSWDGSLVLSPTPVASADQAGLINRALLQLGRGGTLILSAGIYALGSPIVLLPGQTIVGFGATVVPLAAMKAVIHSGGSSRIDGLLIQNSDRLAEAAVLVDADEGSVSHVTSAIIIGFATGIRVGSGAFDVESSFFLNNEVAVAASQQAGSGTISRNYVLGGSGFDLAGDASQGSSTDVVSNVLLPAVSGAYGIRVTGGASVRIERNVVDQIVSGPGVMIQNDAGRIGAVAVSNNYIGTNLYATEATDGIQVSGALTGATITFNTFAGWAGYDLHVEGGSGLVVVGNNLSSTAGAGNIRLDSVRDAALVGNQFESRTASLIEDGITNSNSVGNTFASAQEHAVGSAQAGNRGELSSDAGLSGRALLDARGSGIESNLASSGTESGATLAQSALTSLQLSPEADNAGVINAALARLSPRETLVLPAGTYGIAAPIQLSGRNLVGAGTTLVPLVPMTSAVNVSGGFSSVAGLHLTNAGSLAQSGIAVVKTANNLPIQIQDNIIEGFTQGVTLQGDNFSIERNVLTNNGTGVQLGSYTLNGRVLNNRITGGNGIDLEGGEQQPEGVDISGNQISPGTGGSYAVLIRSALAVQVTGNTIDHVFQGHGIVVDASTAPVAYVSVNGNFISGSLDARAGPSVGLSVTGNVTNTTIAQNRIVNWSGYDLQVVGANKLYVGENSFDSSSGLGNILLRDAGNATVLGNMFGSAVNPVVSEGSTSANVIGNSSSRYTVQANTTATPLGLWERNGSNLAIVVTKLPNNGVVTRANSAALAVGEVLSGDDLSGLRFTPTQGLSGQSSTFSYTVSDGAGNASVGTATLGIADMIDTSLQGAFSITNVSQSRSGGSDGAAYDGPLAYLQRQLIWSGPQAIAARANLPNAFLHGGSGDDALQVAAGSNVLDGGAGSNFLIGASGADGGTDVFFADARGADVVWSTLVNFHAGDSATLWGFDPGVSSWHWDDGQGVGSYTGATLRADVHGNGVNDASITFAGMTMDQVRSLEVSSGNIGGSGYLLLQNPRI